MSVQNLMRKFIVILRQIFFCYLSSVNVAKNNKKVIFLVNFSYLVSTKITFNLVQLSLGVSSTYSCHVVWSSQIVYLKNGSCCMTAVITITNPVVDTLIALSKQRF